MKSSLKILIKEKLVLKKFRGELSINDVQIIFRETKKLKESYPDFNTINDYRGAILTFEKNDFVQLMKYYNKDTFSDTIKLYIVDSPKLFVIYKFYQDNYDFKNTQIFNTLEGACSSNGVNIKLIKDFFG
ncbi:MAG: hypothetical protein COB81_11100 [Flavobacteriaceae bacterium]|nr:MAG: hypothetical protein COB81_11100 [Flavobacteriaceae bacterium]